MVFVRYYPYFCLSIALMALFSVIFMANRKFRPLLVLSGAGSAFFSLSSIIFVPEYWQPVRILNLSIGVEDLLFSFANGGIVWFFSILPIRNRMSVHFKPAGVVSTFLILSSLGAILWSFLFWILGSVMPSLLLSMAVTGGVLIYKNNRYWSLSLSGACGFTLLYMTLLAGAGTCSPMFHNQWTYENLWGVLFLGFPVEEYFWAFGFGAVFPLIMASSFGLRVLEKQA